MYAPLAPLVVICGTIYFWVASIVVRKRPMARYGRSSSIVY